jgi:D-glycerate 3-kinase
MADPHHSTLAAWLASQARAQRPLLVGLNGAQGSGKSTLAAHLQRLLAGSHGLRMAVLSLDDFYLPREERGRLAAAVHPLLATRGVPGTHDLALAQRTLDRLLALRDGERLPLPRFAKARDDRAPQADWPAWQGPADVVLFEGWCVGTPPQARDELAAPVNELESAGDPDGRWRAHVNDQLGGAYAALFARLQRLVVLQAPSFEVVHGWRLEQEAGNAAADPGAAHAMDAAALRRFVAHYERLTRHALRVLPARADVLLELDESRRVIAARYPRAS